MSRKETIETLNIKIKNPSYDEAVNIILGIQQNPDKEVFVTQSININGHDILLKTAAHTLFFDETSTPENLEDVYMTMIEDRDTFVEVTIKDTIRVIREVKI